MFAKLKMDQQKYPYIGIFDNGEIVLFTSDSTGVCLGGGLYHVGKQSDSWVENNAKPFDGIVEISNNKFKE